MRVQEIGRGRIATLVAVGQVSTGLFMAETGIGGRGGEAYSGEGIVAEPVSFLPKGVYHGIESVVEADWRYPSSSAPDRQRIKPLHARGHRLQVL